MPWSSDEGKRAITQWVDGLKPRSVLDIGPGAATYSKLLRTRTEATWSCIEIHGPYVGRFDLWAHYDWVRVADARTDTLWGQYDLIILGDVLEHMTRSDAVSVWRRCRAHASHVIASIPIVDMPQGACEGNEHEAHLHTWSHEEVLDAFEGIKQSSQGDTIGVYLAY